MNFYHLEEYKKLLKRQRLEREIFLANGFDDEAINELFRLDRRSLKSDMRFYHHMQSYLHDESAHEILAEPDEYFGIIDNIESSELHSALGKISPLELDILIRHAVYGESLRKIADSHNVKYSTLRTVYERLKKKMKNILEK